MRVTTRRPRSFAELLERRAGDAPDEVAYTFLEDGDADGARLTWGDLERRARLMASAIAGRVRPGDRALMLCPPGLDFIPAFFGCLAAGVLAVPSYPPRPSRPGDMQADRTIERLRGIVGDAAPAIVIASPIVLERMAAIADAMPELASAAWLSTAAEDGADRPPLRAAAPSAVALLQYTSGSTSAPRGVMVTHANLLHNLAYAHALARHGRGSASVSWLPVNHDMGLIQGVLQPVFSGFPAWLMSPAAFLQRPARWLQAISRVGATVSGAPNFAYDVCVRRVSDEERRTLDLRSWRLAFNGAEPIRSSTLENFHRRFAANGFRATAFRSAYGLAEATLLVTTGRGRSVACGRPSRGVRVEIVDPVTRRRLGPGQTGEIWVAGPGVAAGYWNRRGEHAAVFGARIAGTNDGPFLRTGDLGRFDRGGLHVNGRIKDVLIVRGVKHYPQDIEATVERTSPIVRPGCCAAFALPSDEEERLGLAIEIDGDREPPDLIGAVRQAVAEAHGLRVHFIALVAAGAIPKTTSGKLQRFACRDGVMTGRLAAIALWTEAPPPAVTLAEAS
jgi:acyl-CoA synthetase (AMP-forming)/AMP-acid ligase II